MKPLLIKTLLLLACFIPGELNADPVDPLVVEARGIVQKFFGSLKDELQSVIKDAGPVSAISICKLKAPRISKEFSMLSGWYVARTSLKLRSPHNEPDAWETKVMQTFEARKAEGEPVSKLEYSERLQIDGKQIFRYMKAIEIQELCLNCHGTQIKPEIALILDQLYPKDRARGFEVGDIRGAFSLAKPF
jgi:hypothetical protein